MQAFRLTKAKHLLSCFRERETPTIERGQVLKKLCENGLWFHGESWIVPSWTMFPLNVRNNKATTSGFVTSKTFLQPLYFCFLQQPVPLLWLDNAMHTIEVVAYFFMVDMIGSLVRGKNSSFYTFWMMLLK